MKEKLKKFTTEKCACGKLHATKIPKIIIENGAINKMSKLISEYGAKKVFVLADTNTFDVAGREVCEILNENAISFSSYVFNQERLEPDENTVGVAVMNFDYSCDLLIAVGSGVINDVGKIVSATAKIPYFIVATAPSMDGYASSTSSVTKGGLKVSLPSKCADVIIGDVQVLKNAPIIMLQAGLGDMLAKYVSVAEWKISNIITGEYYCEEIATLIKTALKRCVENAKGLLARDEESVKAVFEGLIISGIAMALAGVTRPASGVEHYFSHVLDMRGLEFNCNVSLHGLQCAVATKTVAGLYEQLINYKPNKQKALSYVKEFNYESWASVLKTFLGKGADAMIILERKEGKYNAQLHKKRLDMIIENWSAIVEIINKEIPKEKQIDFILEQIGAPKTLGEIGIVCDERTLLKPTKDIRDKYVLSRLLWDLGIIDEVAV